MLDCSAPSREDAKLQAVQRASWYFSGNKDAVVLKERGKGLPQKGMRLGVLPEGIMGMFPVYSAVGSAPLLVAMLLFSGCAGKVSAT